MSIISSDSEAAKTYYHYASDELGSITHVTDADGNVLNRYEYDAFGDFTLREETVENRYGFAGEQYDPVANLYYLRARFYNPVIGRFLQEDTYYGDGLNLYTYCHNNPVGYIDPSGHEEMCANKQASIKHIAEQDKITPEAAKKKYEELRASEDYKHLTPEQMRQVVTGEKTLDDFKRERDQFYNKRYLDEQAKRRLSQTPVNGERGHWNGERGHSIFIPSDPNMQRLLRTYGMEGISYKNNVPDFSAFSFGTVEINGMCGGKNGRPTNFKIAYEALSKQTGISVSELKKMKSVNNLTWHECNDMKTMMLVPTEVNSYFGHMGGVGEINLYFDLLEGRL